VENDTGSWRLFTGLAVQPIPHYPTLNHKTEFIFYSTKKNKPLMVGER
tara:strand:+ start:188 stop:331 length:144 start_codon:yes stop_codon:yes gene_type:complete